SLAGVSILFFFFFFFQAEDGIRGFHVTGVQTCALPISFRRRRIDRSGRAFDRSVALVPWRFPKCQRIRAYVLLGYARRRQRLHDAENVEAAGGASARKLYRVEKSVFAGNLRA